MAKKEDTAVTEVNAPEVNTTKHDATTEMAVSVSLDSMSYVCEYCGKVNAITSPGCVRCGKRRPRSEYIAAMNRVRNADNMRERYVEERARLDHEKDEQTRQQIVRLVEDRVAEERANIEAQNAVRLEQETDAIKRTTAREAVLRIINAEREAEARINEANARADDAINGRSRQIQEQIESEREKVLYAAAKRLVSERTGIENAAEERINSERQATERRAQETISEAVEEAKKTEARKAVLKVIASEQSSADKIKLEREAIQRAAMDTVAEERRKAEIDAYTKYTIQKEAIERAVDERIKAEREMLLGRRDNAAPGYGAYGNGAQAGYVQPLTIVPYVNPQQPVYQTCGATQLFRFVPDEQPAAAQTAPATSAKHTETIPAKTAEGQPKAKKSHKGLAASVIAFVLGVIGVFVMLGAQLIPSLTTYLSAVDGFENIAVTLSLFKLTEESELFALFAFENWHGYCVSIGALVFVAAAAINALLALIRAFAKKGFVVGFALSAVELLGAIALTVGVIVGKYNVGESGAMSCYGSFVVAGIAVITFIVSLVGWLVVKKANKAENAEETANK